MQTAEKLKEITIRNRKKFISFESLAYITIFLVSFGTTGFQISSIFFFTFELYLQTKLATYGFKNETYITVRCILKILMYPKAMEFIHPDFFWVIILIHIIQVPPNFMNSSKYGCIFVVVNIFICSFGYYFYYNKSIMFCFSFMYGLLFLFICLFYYQKLFDSKISLLERKLGEFESIVSSLKSHIIRIDMNFFISYINKEFLGFSEDDLKARSLKELPIFNQKKLDELLKTKKTQSYKIRTYHGANEYLFAIHASPILVKEEMIGMTILCTDVTYELETRQKEIQHEKEISALKSKTEFMASISHEVRNPLQALTFSIENLLSNEPRKDQIGILNEAQSSNQLINHIIGDILDSSKIESGNFQLQNKNFELLEAIERSLKINIPQAYKKNLDFNYSIDFHIPRVIKGDNQRLIQILSNLMSNAIKYTNQGKIEFTAKRIDNDVYFSVKDTGIGIKKENLNRIFTMFEQVEQIEGSNSWGIGLSIVKGLIDLMNGKYGVESEYGVGSLFWFQIPIQNSTETISLFDSLLESKFKSIIFVIKDECILNQNHQLLQKMKVENVFISKSTQEISDILKEIPTCKIFVHDDLVHLLPPKISSEQVVIIGNSSNNSKEYNDCLRLFKPLLPSHLMLELIPILKKTYTPDGNELLFGMNVLIVEDHVIIQKCIKRYIEKMNPSKLFVASNGVEGLKIYQNEENIDLIISDLNMPVMDGFEMIKSIKDFDKSKDTKIILCTGELNNQLLSDFAVEWKLQDVLSKPVTFRSLFTSIRQVLAS